MEDVVNKGGEARILPTRIDKKESHPKQEKERGLDIVNERLEDVRFLDEARCHKLPRALQIDFWSKNVPGR